MLISEGAQRRRWRSMSGARATNGLHLCSDASIHVIRPLSVRIQGRDTGIMAAVCVLLAHGHADGVPQLRELYRDLPLFL